MSSESMTLLRFLIVCDNEFMNPELNVLFVTQKDISSSPRIIRQILWLQELGWTVDTIGTDSIAPKLINGKHWRVNIPGKFKRYFAYLALRGRRRYEFLFGKNYPIAQIPNLGTYRLVSIHDLTHLSNRFLNNLPSVNSKTRFLLDLHENFLSPLSRTFLERKAFDRYQKWEVEMLLEFISKCGDSLSISAASSDLVQRYSSHLEREIYLMKNSNEECELFPSSVDQTKISLVHHGVATKSRGIEAYIRALKRLPNKFNLNLMLIGGAPYLLKLKILVRALGLSKRVTFLSPVAATEIPETINRFDIALMVLPPITPNQANALPGKFFDSVQARLMIVTGPNPELAEFVKSRQLGVVIEGWGVNEIVESLSDLSADEISEYKFHSHSVAPEFSWRVEKTTFLKMMGGHFG